MPFRQRGYSRTFLPIICLTDVWGYESQNVGLVGRDCQGPSCVHQGVEFHSPFLLSCASRGRNGKGGMRWTRMNVCI
ncbi:hypothetical protein BDR22DRAFT_830737 [Usnea florida]